ncbi:MAG: hypothetical protein V4480_04090 [Patescibacteria group bacterium]
MEHEWWVKAPILPLFDRGKDLEVRVKAGFFLSAKVGDTIVFNQRIKRRLKAIRIYPSFCAMFENEDHARILPGHGLDQIQQLFHDIYPPEREKKGVYVFELESCTA